MEGGKRKKKEKGFKKRIGMGHVCGPILPAECDYYVLQILIKIT